MIAALIGAWGFIFIFLQISPKVELRILPRWVDPELGRFVLRLEIENTSRVRVKKEVVRLQMLPYSETRQLRLSEWVPFSKESIRKGEEPEKYYDPVEVFGSTLYLYPGEKISVERLECSPDSDKFLHIGLQFRARVLLRWLIIRVFSKGEQWTTTAIIFRPTQEGAVEHVVRPQAGNRGS